MRDIKFKYIFKGLPFSSVNNGFNWHVKIFTLKQIESGLIHLSNFERNLGELVARVQFTGLIDNNGVEIYEGDIVKVLFTDWASKSQDDDRSLDEYLDSLTKVFTVEFYNLAFQLAYPNCFVDGGIDHTDLWCGKHGYIKVIGNIHENPELLK